MRVLTITLNPSLDLTGSIDAINFHKINNVKTLGYQPAGKGINVSKVLKDLGISSMAAGFLGKANSVDFDNFLASENILNQFLLVEGLNRINVKLQYQEQITELNFSGFTVGESDLQKMLARASFWADDFDLIAVCGSLPLGVDGQAFLEFLQILSQNGAKIILDSSKQGLEFGLKTNPYLIKPSLEELQYFAKTEFADTKSIVEYCKNLTAQNVVVSLGAEGALWISKDFVLQAKVPKMENIVSTVGAGDSMVAGFIAGHLNRRAVDIIFRKASACSLMALQQNTVGIFDKNLFAQLSTQVEITEL